MAMEVSILIQALNDGNFDEVDRYNAEMEAEYKRQEAAHKDAEEQKDTADAQQEISGWICEHDDNDQQSPSAPNKITAALQDNPNSDPQKHPYVQRSNQGGNFCQHNPLKPSFIISTNPYETESKTDDLGHKRHSSILYDIVARIRDYYKNPDSMPAFNRANADKRKTTRQRNSSRREAIINLAIVMVMNMDLLSLRIGLPKKDGFISYSLTWLADKANLSKSRAKRAMSDLIHSGVLFSHQRREILDKETKTYRFHVAARAFSDAFFEALGINMQRFSKTRQWKAENNDKQSLNAQKAKGEQKLLLNAIHHQLGTPIAKAYGKKDRTTTDKIKQDQARRTEIISQLLEIAGLRNDPEALKAAIKQRLSAEGLIPAPITTVMSSA